ncbi:hypothetical protein D623_10014115 [Myotis brandtii]|uniref:Uncharacterized protein n=1 Tax=Myotis brandtii TaxID=109478 RepID=S7N6P3_MYOBR|nr:hypothetical protein D623_10014115 [Myotis brandtii]
MALSTSLPGSRAQKCSLQVAASEDQDSLENRRKGMENSSRSAPLQADSPLPRGLQGFPGARVCRVQLGSLPPPCPAMLTLQRCSSSDQCSVVRAPAQAQKGLRFNSRSLPLKIRTL